MKAMLQSEKLTQNYPQLSKDEFERACESLHNSYVESEVETSREWGEVRIRSTVR